MVLYVYSCASRQTENNVICLQSISWSCCSMATPGQYMHCLCIPEHHLVHCRRRSIFSDSDLPIFSTMRGKRVKEQQRRRRRTLKSGHGTMYRLRRPVRLHFLHVEPLAGQACFSHFFFLLRHLEQSYLVLYQAKIFLQFLGIWKIQVSDQRFPNFCSCVGAVTSAASPTYSISSYTRFSTRCHSSIT
jgi:hypothetical protein